MLDGFVKYLRENAARRQISQAYRSGENSIGLQAGSYFHSVEKRVFSKIESKQTLEITDKSHRELTQISGEKPYVESVVVHPFQVYLQGEDSSQAHTEQTFRHKKPEMMMIGLPRPTQQLSSKKYERFAKRSIVPYNSLSTASKRSLSLHDPML